MPSIICSFLALLLLTAPLHAQPGSPFRERPATRGILEQLRKGGYVLYMRHCATDSSRPDRVPKVDFNDCSTQRPLTEEGRRMAATLGRHIRAAKIPVREVVSSPFCRAKESARAAFGVRPLVVEQLAYSANMTSDEKMPNLAATRRFLSTPVARGGNRVIVAHAPNLADLIGYFPKPEGTIVIFKPLGAKGFEYVASIQPESWDRLLE